MLSEALWAHRLSRHGATKVTHFELVYSQEVVLPVEVNLNAYRLTKQNDLDCFLLSFRRRLKMFCVACRPQSNPSRASSDGVPPELTVLGFRSSLLHTGQTGPPGHRWFRSF